MSDGAGLHRIGQKMHAVDEGIGRNDRQMRTRGLPDGRIVADADNDRTRRRCAGRRRFLDDGA